MREIVIVGGGLSGMAAAVELEKQGIDYTLIEVKKRLGGSLGSVEQDGFIVDTGGFALAKDDDLPAELDAYDIPDALYTLGEDALAFKGGMRVLLDQLDQQITAPRLRRMAVSSIGYIDGRYGICLENGLMLDAGALILAVPARYAERMFYGYLPEIAEKLLAFKYDHLLRVGLGIQADALRLPPKLPPDMAYPFAFWTDHPARVPAGCALLQIAVRLNPQTCANLHDVLPEVQRQIGLEDTPLLQRVDYWGEADLLTCYDDDHTENLHAIREQLPEGIRLIGSDYCSQPAQYRGRVRLAERLRQGRTAAQHLAKLIRC